MGSSAAGAGFSWSFTRDRAFRSCSRLYYHQYYGARGGWREDAPQTARLTYRLKQLTTFELVLGTAMHAAARQVAEAVRDRQPIPLVTDLEAQVRRTLNHVWAASRNQTAFQRDPRRSPMLRSVYYGQPVDGALITRISDRLRTCLAALVSCPLWESLRRCPPEAVLVVDAPCSFEYHDVEIWVTPDLIFTPLGEPTVIVDWKTGRTRVDDVQRQLGLYALLARHGLGASPVDGVYVGTEARLLDAEIATVTIDEANLAQVEAWIAESVALMRAQTTTLSVDEPLPISSFLQVDEPGSCSRCNFWELCKADLLGRAPAGQGRME